MGLTKDEAAQLPEILKNAPVWARKPEFHRDLAERATSTPHPANQRVFTPNSPVECLYLIADGVVEQSFGAPGQPWFRKAHRKGQFVGQQGLFVGQHQSTATTLSETTFYRLTAVDVRVLLEKYPDLRELLFCEGRACRLRSIPLFESLSDEDIRWLTFLVEERELPEGADVYAMARRGVHVIDWGQIRVTGPAGLDRPNWCLTSGNFFMSPGVRFGGACSADSATARIPSKLFFMAEEDFSRVLQAFPEIGLLIRAPTDIAAELDAIRLLADDPRITPAHREHLAQYCAWAFVPNGQNASTQGAVGYSFMIVQRGAALVSAVDEQGRLRPRNLYTPGGAFGTTSLTEGRPRDATVRAVRGQPEPGRSALNGAELLILDRRDVQHAFTERPDLWHRGIRLYDQSREAKEGKPSFDWLQEDETVVWHGRGHWLWFAVPMGILVALYLAFILLVAAGGTAISLSSLQKSELAVSIPIITGLIFVPIAIWLLSNYLDDYYVVTNRRITRRDRTLFIREVRTDALLYMVQDVTVDSNLLGRLFDYGDLVVRTASKVGNITFDHVPRPDEVRGFIQKEKAGAVAGARGQDRELLRRGLISGLRLSLPIPDLDQFRALGEHPPSPEDRTPWGRLRAVLFPERRPRQVILQQGRRGKPSWFVRLAERLPERAQEVLIGTPPPPPKPLVGSILWRKHWIDFLRRTGWPLLAVVLILLGIALVAVSPEGSLGLSRFALLAGLFVLSIPAGFWLWYEVSDYRNDIYVVTDEKIIDIERKPLGLGLKQREGSLDKVQTVFVEQNGLWAYILNYGNVIIRTAAADEGFTFETVGAPKSVQKTIFQKVDVYRRRQDEKTAAERQRSLIEGLEVYHELREEREGRVKWGSS